MSKSEHDSDSEPSADGRTPMTEQQEHPGVLVDPTVYCRRCEKLLSEEDGEGARECPKCGIIAKVETEVEYL